MKMALLTSPISGQEGEIKQLKSFVCPLKNILKLKKKNPLPKI